MDESLLPGPVLRGAGPPERADGFAGVQVDDPRFGDVLAADAPLLVLYDGTLHGEGTVWHPGENCLYWSDVPNRRLLRWRPDGEVSVAVEGTWFMNGNAVDAAGRLWHCEHGRRCISRSEPDGGVRPVVTRFEGKRLNSPNDLVVAADGAVWFTDPDFGILMPNQGGMATPELDHQSVYRFDPQSGALQRMADFEQPNGLAFSPDGRILYVSDTGLSLREVPGNRTGSTHEIVAFDVGEAGALSGRRFFCHTDHGVPDGFRVDRRGWVWTTAGDGVHVWSPARERLGFIPMNSVCSNLAFGGADGRRLFVAATERLVALDLAV